MFSLGLKQLMEHSLLIFDYSDKSTFKIMTIINICVEFIVHKTLLNTLLHLRPTKPKQRWGMRIETGSERSKHQEVEGAGPESRSSNSEQRAFYISVSSSPLH